MGAAIGNASSNIGVVQQLTAVLCTLVTHRRQPFGLEVVRQGEIQNRVHRRLRTGSTVPLAHSYLPSSGELAFYTHSPRAIILPTPPVCQTVRVFLRPSTEYR